MTRQIIFALVAIKHLKVKALGRSQSLAVHRSTLTKSTMPRSFLVKKNTERKSVTNRSQSEKVKRLECTDVPRVASTRIAIDKITTNPKTDKTVEQHWNGFATKCVYPAEVTSLASVPSFPKAAVKFDRLSKSLDDRCKSAEDLDRQAGSDQTSERERHQCHQCNKCYSTILGLAKHQQYHCTSHHKKTFTCKHCDKIYVSLGALKMHIRTHTLPCKCKICGKAFSRPWLLQGHIRTHTGERPYVCSVCKRAFADRSNLRAHMQTHAEVKKYSCSRCARSFSRMSLLVKHEDSGCLSISQA